MQKKHKYRLDLKRNYQAYLMALPTLILVFIFCYIPMYGILMAFENYRPKLGVWGSQWVGFKYFIEFFQTPSMFHIVWNTLYMGVYELLVNFPFPILLAILLNEVRAQKFKKCVQTITYMPYFISMVVMCGIIKSFFSLDGVINQINLLVGRSAINYLSSPSLFPSLIVWTDLWQGVGWNSIIYLAALTNISPELYEAASIDGCGRIRKMWHITLPGLAPTIVMLLILSVGGLFAANSEKILLLYSPLTYSTGDVIGTFIYRYGLKGGNYSFTTAVGLFQTVINFLLLIFANWFSKKTTENSLW